MLRFRRRLRSGRAAPALARRRAADQRKDHHRDARHGRAQQRREAAQSPSSPARTAQPANDLVGPQPDAHRGVAPVRRRRPGPALPGLLNDLAVQLASPQSSACVPCAAIPSMVEHHDLVGERDRRGAVGDDDVVRPAITSPSASLIARSVLASTDEVASSRIRIRGSARIARAIASRCRCPPETSGPAHRFACRSPRAGCR